MKAVNYKQIKNMWKKDTGYDPTFNLLYILADIIVNMNNTIAISPPIKLIADYQIKSKVLIYLSKWKTFITQVKTWLKPATETLARGQKQKPLPSFTWI